MNHDELLAYYAAPGVFTSVDEFAAQLAPIPSDIASVARAVQGLLIHEAWIEAYGISLSSRRSSEKGLHSAHAMLTRAAQIDNHAMNQARSPDNRVVSVCRHFATLFVALLRMRGVPSRARCGFATYFDPTGKQLDHWVGEYWSDEQARWVLVDAQIDHLQREALRPDFDPLDVPRDRFLVAGDAWRACAKGADPITFGVGGTTNWGLVEVYGDLFQDLAALQKIELLPWEWYGLANDDRGMKELDLVDSLATISSRADVSAFNDLRDLLTNDGRLGIPDERVIAALTCDRETLEELRSVP